MGNNYEDILEKEGMPAELPRLRMVSLDVIGNYSRRLPPAELSLFPGLLSRWRGLDCCVLRLWCEGRSEREIARTLKITRYRVRKAMRIMRRLIHGRGMRLP